MWSTPSIWSATGAVRPNAPQWSVPSSPRPLPPPDPSGGRRGGGAGVGRRWWRHDLREHRAEVEGGAALVVVHAVPAVGGVRGDDRVGAEFDRRLDGADSGQIRLRVGQQELVDVAGGGGVSPPPPQTRA